MRRARAVGRLLLVLGALSATWAVGTLEAQGRGGDSQTRLLREAATLESQGDLDGAEAALRRVLGIEPRSTGALFALARVMRANGRLPELRLLVDEFLEQGSDVSVRSLKLELLLEGDSQGAMVDEAERWMREEPVAATFAAVSKVYERSLGPDRALEVLRRGREILGPNALALETGDVLVGRGDLDAGVNEWALAVKPDGSGMEYVRSRLLALGPGRFDAGAKLLSALGPTEHPGRRRAALQVALDVGLEEESMALAQEQAEGLTGRAKSVFLNEIGILAREAGLAEVASWSYAVLGENAGSPEERRPFDERIVDIALETGDTIRALEAQRRIIASFGTHSDEWRRARAEAILLQASVDPEGMIASWESFRSEFKDVPELDVVGSAIAVALVARGDTDAAISALEGVEGPRSSLERAYLLLGKNDLEGGKAMLMMAVSGLSPSEATPVIQLLSLLGRLSEGGAQALVAAGVEAHHGRSSEAAVALADRSDSLDEGDRAPLLAEAARLADRGGDEAVAARIRRQLVDQHPEAPEVAEATLELARHVVSTDGDEAEAIRLLEDLIIRQPDAAVVPEARLELERLRNRRS